MADGELFVRIAGRHVQGGIARSVGSAFVRVNLRVGFLIVLLSLTACSKPPAAEPAEATKPNDLERIPAADSSKYPALSNMKDWQNPYLVVRDDGIGLVDLSNREIHVLKPEEVPAELVSLPSSAWPYGRVVLVTQAAPKNASDQTKEELRKNRGLLLGTLRQLDVEVRESP
jgi:hypothetical protein